MRKRIAATNEALRHVGWRHGTLAGEGRVDFTGSFTAFLKLVMVGKSHHWVHHSAC